MADKKLQMPCSKEEFLVVKTVSSVSGFDTISDYLRALVTADIVAKKKSHKHPEIYGMSTHEWDNLSEEEKKQYLNQIAPVRPQSLDYFLAVKKGETDDNMIRTTNELGI